MCKDVQRFTNMCIRPWQGRLVHFEKKLPGANLVGGQPIGTVGYLEIRPSSSLGLRVRTRARDGAVEIELNSGFESALEHTGERSQTPRGNVPGGTLGGRPRDRPEAPARDPEKKHLEELGKNQCALGVSPQNCRVGPTGCTAHLPSSSSLSPPRGDGLHNNSSSQPF